MIFGPLRLAPSPRRCVVSSQSIGDLKRHVATLVLAVALLLGWAASQQYIAENLTGHCRWLSLASGSAGSIHEVRQPLPVGEERTLRLAAWAEAFTLFREAV